MGENLIWITGINEIFTITGSHTGPRNLGIKEAYFD